MIRHLRVPVINPRIYGLSPFSVAVIHGGPGGGSEMAEVAQELCSGRGILEPLQTAHSLQGQIEELKGLLEECADGCVKNRLLARMGELFSRTDSFDPIECKSTESDYSTMSCHADIYQSVWKEASHLRQTGELLALGKKILCPVVAIHGDWDPHPARGVCEPLQATLKRFPFKFIVLEDCGHKPWIERKAKDKFYSILKEVID